MLNSVVRFLKSQEKFNFLVIFLAISGFLPIPASNIAVLIGFIYTVIFFKKPIIWNTLLALPILLFFWIVTSFFWSMQPMLTLYSIPRTVFLLVIPLLFLAIKFDTTHVKESVLKTYSYLAVVVSMAFLIRAIIRFFVYKNSSVFFNHGNYISDMGLVPKNLNAVHVSAFVAIAFFYFLTTKKKGIYNWLCVFILAVFLVLLSSSIVLFTCLFLLLLYFFFFSKSANRMRLRNSVLVLILALILGFYKQTKDYINEEFKTNTEKVIGHNVIPELSKTNHKVTLYEAWNNEQFSPNDFFPALAFRIYQFRMCLEIIKEEKAFWEGLGFNASQIKLEEKGIKYNVFLGDAINEGYQKKNFHNQYLQVFVELGFIGFTHLMLLLFFSLKKALQSKDFIHIAFTILMISLFLTESFLWRQRGVVFFTVFYCLFMAQPKLTTTK